MTAATVTDTLATTSTATVHTELQLEESPLQREELHCDVLIIGAGPSGLATAIQLMQQAKQQGLSLEICVLEKGAAVGAHILSGAVFEPDALTALIPNWHELGAPLKTKVSKDEFVFLTENNSLRLPTPPQMHNDGNYIISLGSLCKWLAEYAESLGVQIFPGFAAAEPVYNANHELIGVITKDMGLGKDGKPRDNFVPGIKLLANYTVLAEGCRGSLTKEIIKKYKLEASTPQTYGLGIKELWEIPANLHQDVLVTHTIGWPKDSSTYGGSFLYHLEPNLLAVGFVVGLDYRNPYLNPFAELQRFKQHPRFRELFADKHSKRIYDGARTLVEGGVQALPKLCFPGGLIVGDAAGFLNVPKIKGSSNAIHSGIVAADTILAAYVAAQQAGKVATSNTDVLPKTLEQYPPAIKATDFYKVLYHVRNIRPSFAKWGLYGGLMYSALTTYVLRGKEPWTFKHHADNLQLKPAAECQPIAYPKPDGVVTFDKLTSVNLSYTMHAETQPSHLQLRKPTVAIDINFKIYNSPEQYYCPAGVYEIVTPAAQAPYLQVNFTNCVHCKACDIKDPTQNINWTTPEGGGPNYVNM
jgi:electron-transferring-flavoprotein dehydrogenase